MSSQGLSGCSESTTKVAAAGYSGIELAATRLPLARCDARVIRGERIEEAIRQELGRCLPSDEVHAACRAELEKSIATPPHPRDVREARVRRLDDQLTRARRLYEYGEYDWDTFLAKRAEIHDAQQSLRNEASVTQARSSSPSTPKLSRSEVSGSWRRRAARGVASSSRWYWSSTLELVRTSTRCG